MKEKEGWHAFISYAQSVDGVLAKHFRDALQKFAKPIFALRRARVFLDTASLAASPDLKDRLNDVLNRTQYLLVFCCPAAAESKWVHKEIEHWLDVHGSSTIVLLKTGGELVWEDGAFDCTVQDNCLPPILRHAFSSEPLWLDLSGWQQLDSIETEPRIRRAVAQVAATLLDLSLDEVEGEDVRAHRRLGRLRNGAVAGLVALALASFLFALQAQRERNIAFERVAAISAVTAAQGDASIENAQRAAALALEAYELQPSPEAWSAASAALGSLTPPVLASPEGLVTVRFSPISNQFAILTENRELRLHREDGQKSASWLLDRDFAFLAWASAGSQLAASTSNGDLITVDIPVSAQSQPREFSVGTHGEVLEIRYAGDDGLIIVAERALVFRNLVTHEERHVSAHVANFSLCGSKVVWVGTDGEVFAIDSLLTGPPVPVHQTGGVVNNIRCREEAQSIATTTESGQLFWTIAGHTSQTELGGLNHIEMSASGNRLAVITGEILPGGRLAPEIGSNQTLLFHQGLKQPYWAHSNYRQSDIAVFRDETLLTVDEGRALLEISPAGDVQELSLPYQVDQIAFGKHPRSVIVATSGGTLYEHHFGGGLVRRLGRTTGWTTSILSSFEASSHLLISQTQDSDVNHQRSIALLVRPEHLGSASISSGVLADATTDGQSGAMLLDQQGSSLRVLRIDSYHPLRTSTVATIAGDFESIAYDEMSGNALLWGQDGGIMLDATGAVLWRKPDWSSLPSFVAGGQLVLHHSEVPELVDAFTGKSVSLPFDEARFGSAVVGADPRFVSIVDEQSQHALWQLSASEPVWQRPANSSWTSQFSPDGTLYAAVDAENSLHLIRLERPGNPLVTLLPASMSGEMVFAQDNSTLFLPLDDRVVGLDTRTGQAFELLKNDGSAISLWVSPPGNFLIAAGERGRTVIVDLESRSQVMQLRFSDSTHHASFCGNERWSALGTADGQTVVVDLFHSAVWADFRVDDFVSELAFSEDCEWVLAGGHKSYQINRREPAALLCDRQIPQLTPAYWNSLGGSGPPPKPCGDDGAG